MATESPESTPPESTPGRRRRIAGALGRASGRLASGIPVGFVAVIAVLVLAGILYAVATRESEAVRGYAELTIFPDNCIVDLSRSISTVGCRQLGPRSYRVRFSKTIDDSTPIASRGSCCPGSIGASAETEQTVVLAVPRTVKAPIRVSVILP
jgi:hypothetical protein